MMSDLSDDIDDFKRYYNIIKEEKVDAVFGSRFIKGSKIIKNDQKHKTSGKYFST